MAMVGMAQAATDYGDYSGFSNASATTSTSIKIGSIAPDSESASNTNLAADADDKGGTDDEDGVVIEGLLMQGKTGTVKITVTSGTTAYLSGWIDFNNNNSLADSGEKIVNNQTISGGTSGVVKTYTFAVPAAAYTAGSVGARFRISTVSGAGPTGASGTGEVEDYKFDIVPPTDYGDDSDLPTAGAYVLSTLKMGASTPDAELPSQTTLNTALQDDQNGTADEDGVTVTTLMQNQTATITVNVTNSTVLPSYLTGWIDYNNNGVLTEANEKVVDNQLISAGTSGVNKTYTITVPVTSATGAVGMRFRLSSVLAAASNGVVGNGEVEDYQVSILPQTDYGDNNALAQAGSTVSANLKMGAGATDAELPTSGNALATTDNTTGTNDEDGVSVTTLMPGTNATVTIAASNSTGSPAYLNGWIDFNNNGTLESSEQVITNQTVASGASGGGIPYAISVRLQQSLARLRLAFASQMRAERPPPDCSERVKWKITNGPSFPPRTSAISINLPTPATRLFPLLKLERQPRTQNSFQPRMPRRQAMTSRAPLMKTA